MDHIQGNSRDQLMIISLDQMVHQEAFVRIIDAFVNAIDISSFGFTNIEHGVEGRPPYHPSDLLKLWFYGYRYNLRSCRKLEQATKVNLEVMWLLKDLKPHYKTISDFRKDNAKAFQNVFRQFVFLLKEWKLVSGKTIAIDSFKVRAQNSLKNNFNKKKIDRHVTYIDNKIEEYLKDFKESNTEEEKKTLRKKLKHNRKKKLKYQQLEKQLEETGQEQISTTDPDARAIVLHRNIVNVGYNIQASSDGKHKMIIGLDTGDVNDTHALSDMVKISQENLKCKVGDVLADKGYHTAAELTKCEQLKVTTYVSPKASAVSHRFNVYPSSDFRYHAGSDTYKCPSGEVLRPNKEYYIRKSKRKEGNDVRFKVYKTKSCKSCPLRSHCTTSKNGRAIQRLEYQGSIDRNNKRVNNNPDYYRLRQQLIEHQFGTIKRQRGFTHVLLRGKHKVLGEASLLFTMYNLGRSMSILGFTGLLDYLKTVNAVIFTIFTQRTLMKPHINLFHFRLCAMS